MPGSFDPFTLGHWDIAVRASRLFEAVIIGVGVHSGKQSLFSVQTRLEMARGAVESLANVEVALMDGVMVDFCKAHGATTVVRGARSGSDFEAEWAMAMMNLSLGNVETVIFPASGSVGFISSSLVRSVAQAGGDVTAYVPRNVSIVMQKER